MKNILIIIGMIASFIMISCKKYLDKKPDIKLAIPTSLADFQSLLDKDDIVEFVTPGVLDLGIDDYYLDYSSFNALIAVPRNCYIWESDIWQGSLTNTWSAPYSRIYIANVVLEGLNEFNVNNAADQLKWNNVYGHALFIRALFHYYLEETFGQPYKPATSSLDLGIPLKLSSNLELIATRSSVQATYDQIINDLEYAKNLLPNTVSSKNRPSKATVFAMLARIYLTMQDYKKAGAFADSSLQISNTLYDYNFVPDPTTNTNSFSGFAPPHDLNFETLFYISQESWGVIYNPTTNIDSELYNSYSNDDLRKTVFFRQNTSTNTYYFKGSYTGGTLRQFGGPAIDEMYLTRAECFARAGNKDAALTDLNALMIKRWKNTISYPGITATDAEDALRKILTERRKELIFRGIRWSDLRRLNQDPRFAITLTRIVNGHTYSLPPNDKKYTYPIPDDEIRLSGIEQNPR